MAKRPKFQLQRPKATSNGQQPGQRQPQQSLFVQSVLRTLNLPAYNPKIFADAAGGPSSSNVAAAAPVLPPVSYQAPAPAPAAATTPPRSPVNPALPSVRQQQQPPTAGNVFGNIAPPAATVKSMAGTVTFEKLFARDNQQQQGVCPPLMFGPFPYQGPRPPVAVRQDMVAPAGDPFTGVAGGGTAIIGASATAATDAGAYYRNEASSFVQPPSLGAEQDGNGELAAMVAMYPMADPPVALPQGIGGGGGASNEASMATPHIDNFSHYRAGSFVAPYHVIGIPANANGLTMAGGAFGSSNAASFMAPQDLGVVVPDGDQQLAPEAGHNIYGSLLGSDQGPAGAATDGNAAGLSAAMFPSEQYEESTLFPLEALLDLHASMYDADLDAQHGGSSSTSGAAAAGVAGTSLIDGEGGTNNWDIGGAADGLEMPDDFFMESTGDFLFPQYMNNGRE